MASFIVAVTEAVLFLRLRCTVSKTSAFIVVVILAPDIVYDQHSFVSRSKKSTNTVSDRAEFVKANLFVLIKLTHPSHA